MFDDLLGLCLRHAHPEHRLRERSEIEGSDEDHGTEQRRALDRLVHHHLQSDHPGDDRRDTDLTLRRSSSAFQPVPDLSDLRNLRLGHDQLRVRRSLEQRDISPFTCL